MSKDEALASTDKICPLLKEPCHGPKCALYVALQKPMTFGDGRTSYLDPEYKLSYRGCGLVMNIPWEPIKREHEKEVPRA